MYSGRRTGIIGRVHRESFKDMTILVTGSAGFIGANFVLDWLHQHDEAVVSWIS